MFTNKILHNIAHDPCAVMCSTLHIDRTKDVLPEEDYLEQILSEDPTINTGYPVTEGRCQRRGSSARTRPRSRACTFCYPSVSCGKCR